MYDYKKIAITLSALRPEHDRLLDIGAYTGNLLNYFKNQGWQVHGLEPDQRAVYYAKQKFNLKMSSETLKHARINPENYDVVIMLHVIEHLDNPAESLSIIHKILGEKGILVIETPSLLKCWGHAASILPKNMKSFLIELRILV